MTDADSDTDREGEIEEILGRKPDTAQVEDRGDRYRVVGAASRETYANWLTPIESHYVCHRNETPVIDPDEWSVSLAGAVDEERSLSMDAIREEYPTVAVAHTMECAGNGRSYFEPETGSVQWGCGAVSTAFWTGTPLDSILRRHGAERSDGMWVTAIGGDEPEDDAVFARSIPLSKALDDCILAYDMNGRPLPPEHGRPVRLLVPGWYGVNSVKWVRELRVMDKMVHGEEWADRNGRDYTYWQQDAYRLHPEGVEPDSNPDVETTDTWEQRASDDVDHAYTFDVNVKSMIGDPTGSVTPRRDGTVEVLGVAWAGDDAVAAVDVSTDGGETWREASFFGPQYRHAWRLFRYVWEPEPGTYTLCSRATDDQDRSQPPTISERTDEQETDNEYPWNEGGYAVNAYEPHALEVTVQEE